MINPIMVPHDGSAIASSALPYAAHLGRAVGAPLSLLRVCEEPRLAFLAGAALQAEQAEQRALLATAEAELAALAQELREQGLMVNCQVREGDPAEVILNTMAAEHAQLVVIATHGRSGLGRWLYGSVADAVVRAAPTPVVLVPPDAPPAWPSDRALRILVAIDELRLAEAMLPAVAALARPLGASLRLVHVCPPQQYDDDPTLARARLGALAEGLRQEGLPIFTQVEMGQPFRTISQVASEQAVDLVALATHGRHGVERTVWGSVATATLRQARVPLLVVGPAFADQGQ